MIQERNGSDAGAAAWRELRRETIPERTRWERRSGQWRALALAREVFGAETGTRLEGFPPRGGFKGLLHLEVPFLDLDDHRDRESLFLALASADPVLERVPLVFVFVPVPELQAAERGG